MNYFIIAYHIFESHNFREKQEKNMIFLQNIIIYFLLSKI